MTEETFYYVAATEDNGWPRQSLYCGNAYTASKCFLEKHPKFAGRGVVMSRQCVVDIAPFYAGRPTYVQPIGKPTVLFKFKTSLELKRYIKQLIWEA